MTATTMPPTHDDSDGKKLTNADAITYLYPDQTLQQVNKENHMKAPKTMILSAVKWKIEYDPPSQPAKTGPTG
jgi:hypothetical protein